MEEIINKANELSELIDSMSGLPSNGSCIILLYSDSPETGAFNIKGSFQELSISIKAMFDANENVKELFQFTLNL